MINVSDLSETNSSLYLVNPVVIVLNQIQDKLQDFTGTLGMDISDRGDSNR